MRRLVLLMVSVVLAAAAPEPPLRGVNLSGAELGAGSLPGQVNHDYIFPDQATLAHFAQAGFSAIRLPVLWERLQPALAAPLDATQMALVDGTIAKAAALHLRTIVDVHDYGRWRGQSIGGSAVPVSAFADLWARIARHVAGLRDGGGVVFGLMNEPHDMPAAPWAAAEQAAIDAIRAAPAGNLILVSGVNWDGAHDFVSGPNAAALAGLRDPGGRMAIELHQYLDADFSGTHPGCLAPAEAAGTLLPATQWLKATHHRGFLGEFAASNSCLASLEAMLKVLDSNRDVWIGWTYWAAGAWWGDYMFSVQPKAGRDAPQMSVLRRHVSKEGQGSALDPSCEARCRVTGPEAPDPHLFRTGGGHTDVQTGESAPSLPKQTGSKDLSLAGPGQSPGLSFLGKRA